MQGDHAAPGPGALLLDDGRHGHDSDMLRHEQPHHHHRSDSKPRRERSKDRAHKHRSSSRSKHHRHRSGSKHRKDRNADGTKVTGGSVPDDSVDVPTSAGVTPAGSLDVSAVVGDTVATSPNRGRSHTPGVDVKQLMTEVEGAVATSDAKTKKRLKRKVGERLTESATVAVCT